MFQTLSELYEAYGKEPLFQPLRDSGSNLVGGSGNPNEPLLMFIGEAPGVMEDLQGIPFIGRAGLKLNEFVGEIKRTRDDDWYTNILKYHPPKNRDPLPEEVELSLKYLLEEIDIILPEFIVTLGRFSMNALLPDQDSIMKANGKFFKSPMIEQLVMPIIHPGALLRPGGDTRKIQIRAAFEKLSQALDEFVYDSSE